MTYKYPELFDQKDMEKWNSNFLRKEIISEEWDLILWEVGPDIYEVPMFTSEFCDKFLDNFSNIKGDQIKAWNHDCEFINIEPEIIRVISNIITKLGYNAMSHVWKVPPNTFSTLREKYSYVRFKKNQDLRIRHDSFMITGLVRFDENSDGGELYFPKYDYTLNPNQGSLYFFPGRITHRYGINLVKKNQTNNLFIHLG